VLSSGDPSPVVLFYVSDNHLWGEIFQNCQKFCNYFRDYTMQLVRHSVFLRIRPAFSLCKGIGTGFFGKATAVSLSCASAKLTRTTGVSQKIGNVAIPIWENNGKSPPKMPMSAMKP